MMIETIKNPYQFFTALPYLFAIYRAKPKTMALTRFLPLRDPKPVHRKKLYVTSVRASHA